MDLAGSIDATQLAVASYLRCIGEVGTPTRCWRSSSKIFFQFKFFLPDPVKNDVKYRTSAQPFLVFGLLTTGLAWGHHINSLTARNASRRRESNTIVRRAKRDSFAAYSKTSAASARETS